MDTEYVDRNHIYKEELLEQEMAFWKSCEPHTLLKSCVFKVSQLLLSRSQVMFYHLPNEINFNPLELPGNLAKEVLKCMFSHTYPHIPEEVGFRSVLQCYLDSVDFRFICSLENLKKLNSMIKILIDYADNVKIINITSVSGYLGKYKPYDGSWWSDETNVVCDLFNNFNQLISKCKKLTKLEVDFLFDNRLLSSLPNIVELNLAFLDQNNELYGYCKELRIWDKIELVQNLPGLRYVNHGNLGLFKPFRFHNLPLTQPCKIRSLCIDITPTNHLFNLIEPLFPDLKDVYLYINIYSLKCLIQMDYLTKYNLHTRGRYMRSYDRFFQCYGPNITSLSMDFGKLPKMKFLYILSLLPNLKILVVKKICICWSKFTRLAQNNETIESAARVLSKLHEFKLVCCKCRHTETFSIYTGFLVFVLNRVKTVQIFKLQYFHYNSNMMFGFIGGNCFDELLEIFCICTVNTQIKSKYYKNKMENELCKRGSLSTLRLEDFVAISELFNRNFCMK